MSRLVRLCVFCFLGMTATRCASEPPPPPPLTLTLTANRSNVPADGTSAVTIAVSGASTPVRLTATQGKWQDSSGGATTIPGDGSATLITCDSLAVLTCGGSVRVNATADDGATGTLLVTFDSLCDRTVPEICSDGIDNNCDGKPDCLDPTCAGKVCSASGKTCSGTACVTVCASVENCADSIDNNCDGNVDCADSDCGPGTQCDPSNTSYECNASGACAEITSNLSLQLVAAPTRIAADGVAPATITATLKNGTVPVGAKTITFAVDPTSSGSVSPTTGSTNIQGRITTQYTSATSSGLQTITGTYDTGTQLITGSVVIDTPALGQVKFISQQYPIMGVKHSSYRENNEIVFQVLDNTGAPYPAGLRVRFTHSPVGRSFIGDTENCTASTCTAEAFTDATGTAKVMLHSGTVASVVSVDAEATAGGISGLASASNIAIVGAKPSGSQIAISCTPRNVPAFVDHDCTNSRVGATVSCTVRLGDRFVNALGVATQTTFSSEAGLAGPPQLTDKDGVAKQSVFVDNAKLPVDVEPLLGPPGPEWSRFYDSGCGPKTHNPRDGLVTIIASANGEEGFVDGSNGKPADGIYNAGENFIDIGEPFVDANDNNVRDANELYLDSNNDGEWDGPNGTWDSTKVIWAETRILYSGHAAIFSDGTDYTHSRWFRGILPPTNDSTPSPEFTVTSSETGGGTATVDYVRVYFADKNFNQLNAQTTYSVAPIAGGVQAKYTFSPSVVDNEGMNFTQQFCDSQSGGACTNTCEGAPCYVVTNINAFAYGNYGTVEIKGGSQPAGAAVLAEAKYGNVSVGLTIGGVCQ
jgi:hypothetical protein